MKTEKININGIKHNFSFWGNPANPKLFLFHGWMDMGASFDFVCQYLQDDYYCIAPDLRGFGHSDHVPNPLGTFFYEYIADAHKIFHHFEPDQKVKMLGHSMGGNILALYAGTFPDRVDHFINIEGFGIMDMAPEEGPKRIHEWIEGAGTYRFKVYQTLDEIADRLIKTNPNLSKDKALFLAKYLSNQVKGGFQIAADPKHKEKNPYLFQLKNIYPFWKNIKAKCQLIIAEETEMKKWVSPDQNLHKELERRLDYFPKDSERVRIKDCGHMVHHEKSQELARLVREFLK